MSDFGVRGEERDMAGGQGGVEDLQRGELTVRVSIVVLACVVLASCAGSGRARTGGDHPVADRLDPALALDLYRALGAEHPKQNLVFSPFSLAVALAMTAEGANFATAEEMAAVLHLQARAGLPGTKACVVDAAPIRGALDGLRARFPTGKKGELIFANSMWAEKSFPLNDAFRDVVAGKYQAEFFPVDFRADGVEAARRINAWVAEAVGGRLDSLPVELTPDTRLVLVNAVLFQSGWTQSFPENETAEGPFHLGDGTSVLVPLMRANITSGRFAEFDAQGDARRVHGLADRAGEPGFSMIELPYSLPGLAMVVIAPDEPSGLPLVERLLTPERLTGWFSQLQPTAVEVVLPRFKMEEMYNLNSVLRQLGLRRAFTGKADFPDPSAGSTSGSLQISSVAQRVVVDVQERGTEAASATAVALAEGVLEDEKPVALPPVFHADRPYLFFIRDRDTGAVLFMGRMLRP